MKRNHQLPFGYCCENGKFKPCPTEAPAAKDVFKLYIAGNSYQSIAQIMESRQVSYHPGSNAWNKNMVKRILENERYVGTGEFPRLIEKEVFESAAAIQASKTAGYAKLPPEIKAVRYKVYCAECGQPIKRSSKRKNYIRWQCAGEKEHIGYILDDDFLISSVVKLMNQLAQKPSLVELPALSLDTDNIELMRMNNELQRELSKQGCSKEYAEKLIFAIAANKFQSFDDGETARISTKIRQLFEQHTSSECLDISLFEKTVMKCLFAPDSSASFILRSGQTISTTE